MYKKISKFSEGKFTLWPLMSVCWLVRGRLVGWSVCLSWCWKLHFHAPDVAIACPSVCTVCTVNWLGAARCLLLPGALVHFLVDRSRPHKPVQLLRRDVQLRPWALQEPDLRQALRGRRWGPRPHLLIWPGELARMLASIDGRLYKIPDMAKQAKSIHISIPDRMWWAGSWRTS